MSEGVLERLRYYAKVDPDKEVSIYPGDVIEAIDALLASHPIPTPAEGEHWCPVKGCTNNYENKCIISECSIPRR